MVEDHFAILKVGPALTFAYREAVFALAMIEKELFNGDQCSNLIKIIDQVMIENPLHWEKYYHGDVTIKRFARKYSYSDRIRYYWNNERVKLALEKLYSNLAIKPLPLSLISQYMPEQYEEIRSGNLANAPDACTKSKIFKVLDDYRYATADIH
jgi:D-tagatose-1,6-bisphosphate aldolase subunit GatZ/KbaZ